MEHEAHLADLVTGIVLLLLIAAATTMLSKSKPFSKLPLTIALVLVGILINNFGAHVPGLGSLSTFELTPDLVLFVFIPTLIFESAFNLDARQVTRNILPILILAVPGLLVSTAIIGTFIWWLTPFELIVALLLGAILSATDPVAVISIFKQLGVPERLTVLVEGESLFNDATSLVLAMLLIGILVAGTFSAEVVVSGVLEFFVVFFGGALVGWVAAVFVGETLGTIESDPAIEITLTTILAYFSFIIAEHAFHVSGIMAVVAAGLTIGSWGKSKISPSTAEFMEHFWEYLAYVANVTIFLMVGMQMDLAFLWESIDLIAYVVVAMLISRAVVVFALAPLVGRLPGSERISLSFQLVMYWGGLRGAIALAIVLSMPDIELKNTLIAIVMGAVLFTLIVQGLTIERLVKFLGLDELSLADKLAKLEGDRDARREGLDRLGNLVAGGLFSQRISDQIEKRCSTELADLEQQVARLKDDMELGESTKILAMRCLVREKARYYELFSKGLINEWAFRELDHTVNVKLDEVRHHDKLQDATIEASLGKAATAFFIRILDYVPGFGRLVDRLRTTRIVRDYDIAWGRYRAAKSILSRLDSMARDDELEESTVERVRALYEDILNQVKAQIDEVAELYPEFVETMQEQLGQRLLLIAEHESVEHAAELGMLQRGIASKILKDQSDRLRQLKSDDATALFEVEVGELLRKVPFLQGIDESEFDTIGRYLRPRTFPRGTDIIKQGREGDSMFFIARGIAHVVIRDNGEENQVATLYAGDIFGEGALLHGTARNATARAATPCSLYELKRADLDKIFAAYPSIREAVEKTDRERITSNISG